MTTRIRAGTKYNPSFCDDLIDMAAKGYSALGFCGAIGICEKTFYNWLEAHPEFAEAHEIAQAARVYGAETKLLNAADTVSLNRSQALLRAHGGKIWNPKDPKGDDGRLTPIDFSMMSEGALAELKQALVARVAEQHRTAYPPGALFAEGRPPL